MMNPILISSARRRMRSFRTPLVFALYALALLLLVYGVVLLRLGSPTIRITDAGNAQTGYPLLAILQFVLIIMVAPAMTSSAISGERERQTLDLLLVTNTGSLRIVVGKLLESFAFLGLIVLSSAPFLATMLLVGGVTLAQVVKLLMFLLAEALACLSVGLLCSTLVKRTITATVISYLVIFAIGIVTLAPLLIGRMENAELIRRYADDRALLEALPNERIFSVLPGSIILNPGVGLFSLLTEQTDILRRALRGAISEGGVYFTLLTKLGLSWVANMNALFMAVSGICLTLLAALFVRPRVRVRRGSK